MKLLYFIIIIGIIYFIATQIKVSHIEYLPDQPKEELENKNKFRSMLTTTHVPHNEYEKNFLESQESEKIIDGVTEGVTEGMAPLNYSTEQTLNKLYKNYHDTDFSNLKRQKIDFKKLNFDKVIDGEISDPTDPKLHRPFGDHSEVDFRRTRLGEKNPLIDDNRQIGWGNKYSSEQYDSRDYKKNFFDLTEDPTGAKILPNASELFMLIRSEHMDEFYRFNIPNVPVTSRCPSHATAHEDAIYIEQIKKNIMSWNDLFKKYYQIDDRLLKIRDLKLLFVKETDHEFVVYAIVSLGYLGRTIHFYLIYYGSIEKTDDFINGPSDYYVLQLVNIRPISKTDFQAKIEQEEVPDFSGPFMKMSDQLEYVDRMNKLHKSELGLD